jgi:type IV secretory pathway VirB9-like protein
MRLLLLTLVSLLPAWAAFAQPIVSDSRIKTLVYNPNEVFTITTHYGYQANIEFGAREDIETVSVGDRVGWQIVPAGRRLFIRAMEENAHTNMTVITNKRAYQFDLRSSASDAVYGSEELVYVVRFFFPDEGGTPPPASMLGVPVSTAKPSLVLAAPAPEVAVAPVTPSVTPVAAPVATPVAAPVATSVAIPPSTPPAPEASLPAPALLDRSPQPVQVGTLQAAEPVTRGELNYRYTYTGPSTIAPVKIFDDGTSTYFKFRPGAPLPRLTVLAPNGQEISVPYQINAEGFAVVNVVAPRFSLRENGYEVVVYNEAKTAG